MPSTNTISSGVDLTRPSEEPPHLKAQQLVHDPQDLLDRQRLVNIIVYVKRVAGLETATIHLGVHNLFAEKSQMTCLTPRSPGAFTDLESPDGLKQSEEDIFADLARGQGWKELVGQLQHGKSSW